MGIAKFYKRYKETISQVFFACRLSMLSTVDLTKSENNDISTDDIIYYMLNGGYLLLVVRKSLYSKYNKNCLVILIIKNV